MRWRSYSVLAVVVVAALSGCATTAAVTSSPATPQTGHPDGLVDAVPVRALHALRHPRAGIQGKYYVRAGGPLGDGQGNPPAGWDNPDQRGALTVYTTKAFFTDGKGHREMFMLRPGATAFETLCS